ncbi:unnamed protein product [Aspergillus oryzae]|uniref:Unnamed protein product n=1 Tax=Aspergillus oryzae var. brunneus TaxID=332754 RepID=A0ABQ6KX77_ASPOZ|nr:unnamed protein product [Aspergillus oryzae]GMF89657.1 unnamed protein product [Aspergillus oryzae]GMG50161.1 unnamed protein product [Aspergillus oryzae var. brunneus]
MLRHDRERRDLAVNDGVHESEHVVGADGRKSVPEDPVIDLRPDIAEIHPGLVCSEEAGCFRAREVAGDDGANGPAEEPASIGAGNAEEACWDRSVRLVGDVFIDGEDLIHDFEYV